MKVQGVANAALTATTTPVVYPGVDGSTGVAVPALGDGTTRIATHIPDAFLLMEYTHPLSDGDKGTQAVEPTADTAYPIVADPLVSFVIQPQLASMKCI